MVSQYRKVAKSVIKKCLICYKQQSERFGLLPMAPLPQIRVNFTFPFPHTGVDFIGPVFVRTVFHNKDQTLDKCS